MKREEKQCYKNVRELLCSDEYGPLAKFFILLRMDAMLEAMDQNRKKRVWKNVKEEVDKSEF